VFNIYISLIVSVLQVFSVLKYIRNLRQFKLDIIISKDRAITRLFKIWEEEDKLLQTEGASEKPQQKQMVEDDDSSLNRDSAVRISISEDAAEAD
jgi:hypothetical protein